MALKRKVLSIEEKVKVIREIENGRKKADVCRKFGLVNSTVQTIWKNKTKIIDAFEQNGSRIKRLRKPERSDVDEALLKWFKQQRSDNIPVSGPLLMVKAEEFAKKLKDEEFVCSAGWIDRFKLRHNITFGKVSGEARGVNTETTTEWLRKVSCDELGQYDYEAYATIDDDIVTTEAQTDDIVSEVKEDRAEEDTQEEDEERGEECSEVSIPTVSDALEAIRVVNLFYESRGGSSEIVTKIMDIERNLESVYWASNRKQMKITDYCTRI